MFWTLILTVSQQTWAAIGDEYGVRFHEEISAMEKRYQCKWSPGMMAEYCWALVRDGPDEKYKRKSQV
jgi:hypothetical protein